MKTKTFSLIIMLFFYGIDCLIVTPYGLKTCETCKEVGPVAGFLFNYIGFWTFPIMFILVGLVMYGLLSLYDKSKNKEFYYGIVTGLSMGVNILVIYLNIRTILN